MKTVKYILAIIVSYIILIIKEYLVAIYAIGVGIPLFVLVYFFNVNPKAIKWIVALINYPISWMSGFVYVAWIAMNSRRNKLKTLLEVKFYLIDDLEPIEMLHVYEMPDESLSPYGWYFWSYGNRYHIQENLLQEKGSYTFLEES